MPQDYSDSARKNGGITLFPGGKHQYVDISEPLPDYSQSAKAHGGISLPKPGQNLTVDYAQQHWGSLNTQQRDQLLTKMTPQQQDQLVNALMWQEIQKGAGAVQSAFDAARQWTEQPVNLLQDVEGKKMRQDVAAGALDVLEPFVHPMDVLKKTWEQEKDKIQHPQNHIAENIFGPSADIVKGLVKNPARTLTGLAGGAALAEAGAEALPVVTDAAKAALKTTEPEAGFVEIPGGSEQPLSSEEAHALFKKRAQEAGLNVEGAYLPYESNYIKINDIPSVNSRNGSVSPEIRISNHGAANFRPTLGNWEGGTRSDFDKWADQTINDIKTLRDQGIDAYNTRQELARADRLEAYAEKARKDGNETLAKSYEKDARKIRQQYEENPEQLQERHQKFDELANAQRGKPEEAMLRLQMHPMGAGIYSNAAEHIGDLTHRMSENFGVDENAGFRGGYGNVKEKVDKTLRWLTNDYGFEREHQGNLRNNWDARDEARNKFSNLQDAIADYTAKKRAYSAEHEKLPVYNKMQELARDAAVALGKDDYEGAITNLRELKDNLDKGRKHWEQVAGEYDPNYGKAER